MRNEDVTRGTLAMADGQPVTVIRKDNGEGSRQMALVVPGDKVLDRGLGKVGWWVYVSRMEPRKTVAEADRKHVVEFRRKEDDNTVTPWTKVEGYTGPDSYSRAVEHARRFAHVNAGGDARVRVVLMEVMDECEC